ncbi:trifunctional hydroxymethylpyrimidine kinase/phosphomethylpyrimidine kinase/thiaminase [Savitreella phatthalungensis]
MEGTAMPRAMTVAGSDSGGGAGIQADLKVMTAHSVYGTSVLTAVTSQNTMGVDAVQILDAELVRKQFRAVYEDIGADVIKTGMLGNSAIVHTVSELLKEYRIEKTVIDPVMVATTGARLLEHDAIKAFIDELLPLAYVLTPNMEEARLLVAESRGKQVDDTTAVRTLDEMVELAEALRRLGPTYVLLKGGHLPLDASHGVAATKESRETVCDLLVGPDRLQHRIFSKWSPSRNTHGTGCTLASAIACQLALGADVVGGVDKAVEYVHGAISTAGDLGKGSGPLNHMYRLSALPCAPGKFVDYLIAHPKVAPAWHAYTHHPFVEQLAAGTLPRKAFEHFLRQDYLYLVQYSRLVGLAAYKAERLDDIVGSARIILHIREELSLHVGYCKEFGISEEELAGGEESVACTVYTRYIESIGNTRDWMSLQVALAACLIGYGEIGKRLVEHPLTRKESPYYRWISNYAEQDYTQAVETGRAIIEQHAPRQSPHRLEEFVEIFRKVTEYEGLFWTSAMEAAAAAEADPASPPGKSSLVS